MALGGLFGEPYGYYGGPWYKSYAYDTEPYNSYAYYAEPTYSYASFGGPWLGSYASFGNPCTCSSW